MARMDLLGDLRELVEQELRRMGYAAAPSANLDSVLYRYLNVVRRIPPLLHWTVFESRQVTGKVLPVDVANGLVLFKNKAGSGQDLRPHCSTRIGDADYSDLLFFDWGILHFHLGTVVDDRGFVGRTRELLFAMLDSNSGSMYLLDVLPHGGSFAKQDLLRIVEVNWPHLVERHTLTGITGVRRRFSDEEVSGLRRAGVNLMLETPGGNVLAPMGGGLSTAGTSLENTRSADWARAVVRKVQADVEGARSNLEQQFRTLYGLGWDDLHFRMTSFGKDVVVTEMRTGAVVLRGAIK